MHIGPSCKVACAPITTSNGYSLYIAAQFSDCVYYTLIRELTELLRLTCQAASGAYADYELTSEPHHRLIIDTIERLGNHRGGLRVVMCEERFPVSICISLSCPYIRLLSSF